MASILESLDANTVHKQLQFWQPCCLLHNHNRNRYRLDQNINLHTTISTIIVQYAPPLNPSPSDLPQNKQSEYSNGTLRFPVQVRAINYMYTTWEARGGACSAYLFSTSDFGCTCIVIFFTEFVLPRVHMDSWCYMYLVAASCVVPCYSVP